MGREPHAMTIPRQPPRDREEGLHVAPGADDEDRDRERGNRPCLVESMVRGPGRVEEVFVSARRPIVELDLHAVAVENRHPSDRVVDQRAQACMVESAPEQKTGRVCVAHLLEGLAPSAAQIEDGCRPHARIALQSGRKRRAARRRRADRRTTLHLPDRRSHRRPITDPTGARACQRIVTSDERRSRSLARGSRPAAGGRSRRRGRSPCRRPACGRRRSSTRRSRTRGASGPC
jgi:hypothetical protein